MFYHDVEGLRKDILNSNLLRLPEEIETQITSIAPAIPDGLTTLYKPKQTFSSTVKPAAEARELFEVKIRNGWVDEDRLEQGLSVMKETGKFELSASDRERACTREIIIHTTRLRALENERDTGFSRYIRDERLQNYLSTLSPFDLAALSQFLDSIEGWAAPCSDIWQSLLRRIVIGLHGGAISNLAHRIYYLCKSYLRSPPRYISIAEKRYQIPISAAPVGVSIPVWKCAHWLASKASPENPFIFAVNSTVRDRIVGLNAVMQYAAKCSAGGNQAPSATLSSRMAFAITL
ncbi:hypothetical protein [Aurantimonas coralicida]|nr:hypothetical protein [Aurantimonas coralicida]